MKTKIFKLNAHTTIELFGYSDAPGLAELCVYYKTEYSGGIERADRLTALANAILKGLKERRRK